MSGELAHATACLAQADSDRTAVVEEIRKIEELKESGFVGLAKITLLSIDTPEDATVTVDYTLSDHHLLIKKSKDIAHKSLGEEVEILVKDKMTTYVDVTATVTLKSSDVDVEITTNEEGETIASTQDTGIVPAAPHTQYSVRLQVSEFLDDEELRLELESMNLGTESLTSTAPLMRVKISYDDVNVVLAHKMLALEQAQGEFDKASHLVKDAKKSLEAEKKKTTTTTSASAASSSKSGEKSSKKTGAKGKKGSRKSTTTATTENSNNDATESSSSSTSQSMTEQVSAAAIATVSMIVQHRAVVLFALAAVGIYNYGDLASV